MDGQTAQLLGPLVNLGVAGFVIWWLTTQTAARLDRIERAIDRIERAMDRTSRATMLDVLARPGTPEPVKRQAAALLRELQAAGAAREADNGGAAS